jgi:thioredoxin-related protein
MKFRLFITCLLTFVALGFEACRNQKGHSGEKPVSSVSTELRWYSFADAFKEADKKPKKFFIDVYTDWCGWCKKMDANTFSHPVIIRKLNENFYPIKFDAESKDTLVINGITYKSTFPTQARSTHEFAIALLGNRLSYPTTLYLDESFNLLGPVPGYLDAKTMEAILDYYAGEHYKHTPWEQFRLEHKGEIK